MWTGTRRAAARRTTRLGTADPRIACTIIISMIIISMIIIIIIIITINIIIIIIIIIIIVHTVASLCPCGQFVWNW